MIDQVAFYSLSLVILGAAILSFIPGAIRVQIWEYRFFTWLLGKVENHFRNNSSSPHTGGTFMLLFLITGMFVPVSFIINFTSTNNAFLGLGIEIAIVFFTLSCPPTHRAFMGLFQGLVREEKDEYVAEQKTLFMGGDRVVSSYFTPILFTIIGGAALAVAVEIVRCAYLKFSINGDPFGKPAANFYRIINYLPTLGAVFLLGLTSFLFGKNGWRAIKEGLQEGRRTEQIGHYIQGTLNSILASSPKLTSAKRVSRASTLLFISAFFWLVGWAVLRFYLPQLIALFS